jgi:hypothetical protein
MKKTYILDPRKEPNKWLRSTLLQCLEDGDDNSKGMLRYAIDQFSHWIEPGNIDFLFAPWITAYLEILAEEENKRSNFDPPCSLEDPWE